MSVYCTNCGAQLADGASFCTQCGAKVEQQTAATPPAAAPAQPAPGQAVQTSPNMGIWFQNFYRIRKKVLTVGNKYWIEDPNGNLLAYTKQKLFKLKEDIRIYADESMSFELFHIKQEQIFDVWGTFAVIDTATNMKIGYVKRSLMSEIARDAWEFYDTNNQPIGKVYEKSLGEALVRKFIPGGGLVPETMVLEVGGQQVAEVRQQFKIIGDIWDMDCSRVPPTLDRRVLLSCLILMGCIERDRK